MTQENFSPSSRYYLQEKAKYTKKDGTVVNYIKRRFIPKSEQFTVIGEYSVSEGDRPDTVSCELLGDSEQFWQLCDSNNITHPNDLTETIGQKLKVTLPNV